MGFLSLDDAKLASIATEVALPVNAVKFVYNLYKSTIDSRMEKQYFAHSIRAMEQFAAYMGRQVHIRHWALKDCRFPCYVDDNKSYFHIYYPDTFPADSKEIRMGIAHELGHLFFSTNARKEGNSEKEESITEEEVAKVFGLFLLLGRSALYLEKKDVFGGMPEEDIAKEYAAFCAAIPQSTVGIKWGKEN
jgi:hypothetical protein